VKQMRTVLLWAIRQCEEVIPYLLGFLTLEEGTNSLSRKVGEELPLHTA
jgi:hypothetical protein